MTENPVFSIITVTLNNLPGLQKTDHSLKLQSFRDFEWIVIDGGSSDGTQGYLAHSNASWLSRQDSGIYDAMNIGLAKASGDYVLFLNAGDKLAFANTLGRLHNFIRSARKPSDFIYGDSLEGSAYKPARPHNRLKLGMFTHHQAMVYRRSILNGLSYDTRYKIAADYGLTAKVLQQAKNIDYYPLPVCVFEEGGISQQKAWKGRAEQFLIRRRLKIAGPLENVAIYLLQAAAWTGRRIAPAIYWRVKSSGNRRPGFAQN